MRVVIPQVGTILLSPFQLHLLLIYLRINDIIIIDVIQRQEALPMSDENEIFYYSMTIISFLIISIAITLADHSSLLKIKPQRISNLFSFMFHNPTTPHRL